MAEALLWATTPTFPNGANSLLIGSAEDGYIAFDYLIDLPLVSSMPDLSWSILAEAVTSLEAHLLAEHALRTGRHDQALLAYRQAAEAGYSPAEAVLVDLGAPFRPLPESLERARRHLELTLREFGPDHENTFRAKQSIVMINAYSGRYNDARRLAEELASKGETVLGPNHRLVLAAKFSAAYCTFAIDAADAALTRLDAVVEEASCALGPLDTATLHRRIMIVYLLTNVGKADIAQKRLISLRKDCAGFPAAHFINTALRHVEQLLDGA